uniref:RING finger protein 207-like n=1 Tax=Diabrotica virgifera virgifera TaxID=50390 RepID=A0A6P7GI09_DIAVI
MEPPGMDSGLEFPKNPLLCPICHDYFTEPCILNCYHTFCARCLRGRDQDRRLICPFCRQPTTLKDGSTLPPPDSLMRQLIDIANSENPPCSNCDKRDRSNMYYCNTCGNALNFMLLSKFYYFRVRELAFPSLKDQRDSRMCALHGEHYIMFSPLQNTMLCVNCFRDLPNEMRTQCVDIDTAHAQAAKRLERGQNAIMDLQTSVRDGIIALKGLMDELRRNMDSEKHTINTFCHGMQEAMAKTHATMIMEVQRQYESKERIYRSQLVVLGTVMPVLQLHLVLCTTFTAAANKYQFLELCPSLIERLSAVGNLSQPVRSLQSSQIKTNYRSEFAQSLEPWIGPAAVSQHQSELAARQALCLHCRENTHRAKMFSTHDVVHMSKCAKEAKKKKLHGCEALDRTPSSPLLRQQKELDRMASAFDASWEEQLWRLRVEQEVFSCQRADVNTLRNELKHISQVVATQLEPYIRSLTPAQQQQQQQQGQTEQTQVSQAEQAQHLASLLEHIGLLQQSDSSMGKIPRSRSRVLGQLLEKVRPNVQERERSKSAGQVDKPLTTTSQKATPKKPFISSQQMNIDRLEAQIKEKIQDILSRRQSQPSSKSDTETERKLAKDDRKMSSTDSIGKLNSKQRIMYKKINKSCDKINTGSKSDSETRKSRSESDYQRISDATSQNLKGLVHGSRSSPSSPKCKNKGLLATKPQKKKVYPYSDGEDNVFYSMHDSADSLSTSSRRSSFDGPDKTLVVVINRRNKNMTMAQKQRSWETFPPKRKHHVCHQKLSVPTPPMAPIRKADSFEGHEEAVKSLVAAVQETRRKPRSGN